MSDSEKAAKVMEALKAAEREPAQIALPILNGIVGLVQGEQEQGLEVEEARSSAFLAICEVGKALHHFDKCPACGQWFDMRDLGEVLAHVHGADIEIGATGLSARDERLRRLAGR